MTCNFILIVISIVIVMQSAGRLADQSSGRFVGDYRDNSPNKSAEDRYGAVAIRALRQLARLQFLEGRSEEATATCRQVVDIGHHLRPPSRESVRELFAVAALLRKHGKMADAEFVISQAILGVSKPPTEKQ